MEHESDERVANQRGQEPLNTKPEKSTSLEAVTRRLVKNYEDLKCAIVSYLELELVKLLQLFVVTIC
jgi:hypothetical protein